MREWDVRVNDWKIMSKKGLKSWQQQAALAASMQKLSQGATQRPQPTASDTEGGLNLSFCL